MSREKVIVRQFARAHKGILAGDWTALDTAETENNLELKKEVEERNLHRMTKVHDFSEMWQGSQNSRATQKALLAQNKEMTTVGYISETEEIIKASCSNFQLDGAAAFKLSERSPLPQALSAKDLPGRRTQVLNFRWICRIDHYPSESDENSAPENISDTENTLNCHGDLDNPNWERRQLWGRWWIWYRAMHWHQGLGMPRARCCKHSTECSWIDLPNMEVNETGWKGLVTVSATETRRNQGNKKQYDRLGQ